MLKKENKYITQKTLEIALDRNKNSIEKILGKALESQSESILEAVDFGFKKVDKDITELKQDVSALKQDVSALKQNIIKLDENDKKFLTQQDRISKQLTDLQDESKAGFSLYSRHDKKIENHEKRISELELKTAPIL